MIKFFRRLRKKQLKSKEIRKYLLYAFGEIVLVVIGILIALQINTWNESRIDQAQTDLYLTEISEDLKVDTAAFSREIKYYDNIINFKQPLLSLSNLDSVSTENLERLCESKWASHEITIIGYQNYLNSGLDRNSHQVDLFKQLDNYYTTDQHLHNLMNNWEIEFTNKEGSYWFYEQDEYEFTFGEYDGFPTLQAPEKNRQNLIKLIQSPQGRNHLKQEYSRKNRRHEHLISMLDKATTLLKVVETELR